MGASRLLVLRLVTLDCGAGGCTTRVTLNRELVKKVGELPVERLPPDNGDRPFPLPVLPAASVTLDTWKRLRDGLARGLTIGEGNGDLSRLSQLKRLDLDFLTFTVGGDTTTTLDDDGDGDGDGVTMKHDEDELGDNESSIMGGVMLVTGDGDLMVVVLSKLDAFVVSVLQVGDVRIMF